MSLVSAKRTVVCDVLSTPQQATTERGCCARWSRESVRRLPPHYDASAYEGRSSSPSHVAPRQYTARSNPFFTFSSQRAFFASRPFYFTPISCITLTALFDLIFYLFIYLIKNKSWFSRVSRRARGASKRFPILSVST